MKPEDRDLEQLFQAQRVEDLRDTPAFRELLPTQEAPLTAPASATAVRRLPRALKALVLVAAALLVIVFGRLWSNRNERGALAHEWHALCDAALAALGESEAEEHMISLTDSLLDPFEPTTD